MMNHLRPLLLWLLPATLLACGNRATPLGDGSRDGARDRGVVEVRVTEAASLDQPPTCASFSKLGQVMLDYGEELKDAPAVAFDGERFAVVWHRQSPQISSPYGDLRFALVDGAGKTAAPGGLPVAADDAALRPALVAGSGAYAVLHRLTPAAGGSLELRRFDAQGSTLAALPVPHQVTAVSLTTNPFATNPATYPALLVENPSPKLVHLTAAPPTVSEAATLITAQVIDAAWLAPRTAGFAAVIHSTNHNATLYLLDEKLQVQAQQPVGQGAALLAPALTVLPAGLAAVYASSDHTLRSQRFDAAGTPAMPQQLASDALADEGGDRPVVVWTGAELLVVYPWSTVPGQHRLLRLDESGKPLGAPAQVPGCLATGSRASIAWGQGRLAVASVGSASGLPVSTVCVTLLGCP